MSEKTATPQRSNEPVFWALFGAGGVLTALLLPALVFITGLAVPLGLISPDALSYPRMLALVASWPGKLFLWFFIALTLWHAMHRIYHTLHDLGVRRALPLFRVLSYGSALLGTVIAAYYVLMMS